MENLLKLKDVEIITVVLLAIVLLIIWLNIGKNRYISQLRLPIGISGLVILIVLCGNFLFNGQESIFSKLASGEILVGIAIAPTTMYMWYKRDFEKEHEKSIELLKQDYSSWLESFYTKEEVTVLDHARLSRLIEAEKQIEENLEKHQPNKRFLEPTIDWSYLFLVIQERLKRISLDRSDEIELIVFKEWIKLNSKIIEIMREYRQLSDEVKNLDTLYAIDLKGDLIFLKNFKNISALSMCRINWKPFKKYLENRNKEIIQTKNIIFDQEVEKEHIESLPIGIEGYYIEDIGIRYISLVDEIAQEKIYKGTNKKIFENRDLSHFGAINQYILGEQAFNVIIVQNDSSNLNVRIYEALQSELEKKGLPQINAPYFLSKSKNYLPNMKETEKGKWIWHSWNVLLETKAVDATIQYYIFAVNTGEHKYSCVIIEREKFDDLIQFKNKSKDNRYFFYFAEEGK